MAIKDRYGPGGDDQAGGGKSPQDTRGKDSGYGPGNARSHTGTGSSTYGGLSIGAEGSPEPDRLRTTSSDDDDLIDLHNSVAGEEDPGASLDTPPDAAERAAQRRKQR